MIKNIYFMNYLTPAAICLLCLFKFLANPAVFGYIRLLSIFSRTLCSICLNIINIQTFLCRLLAVLIFYVDFFRPHPQLSIKIRAPLYDIVQPFGGQQYLICPLNTLPFHNIFELQSPSQSSNNSFPLHSTFLHPLVQRGQLD